MINSKQQGVQNLGPWGPWPLVVENSQLFAQRGHSARCATFILFTRDAHVQHILVRPSTQDTQVSQVICLCILLPAVTHGLLDGQLSIPRTEQIAVCRPVMHQAQWTASPAHPRVLHILLATYK